MYVQGNYQPFFLISLSYMSEQNQDSASRHQQPDFSKKIKSVTTLI